MKNGAENLVYKNFYYSKGKKLTFANKVKDFIIMKKDNNKIRNIIKLY